MDADHLARVSKCWDLDVVEFRERLRERDIDDDAVASLQEAIRESAYEHFVVRGMRRYLLNRDKGDGGEGAAASGGAGSPWGRRSGSPPRGRSSSPPGDQQQQCAERKE